MIFPIFKLSSVVVRKLCDNVIIVDMSSGGLGGLFTQKEGAPQKKKSLQVSSTFFPHLQVIDPQKSPPTPRSLLNQEMMNLHSSCLFVQDIIASKGVDAEDGYID